MALRSRRTKMKWHLIQISQAKRFHFSEGSAAVRSSADATNLLDESHDCWPLDLVFCFIVAPSVSLFAASPSPPPPPPPAGVFFDDGSNQEPTGATHGPNMAAEMMIIRINNDLIHVARFLCSLSLSFRLVLFRSSATSRSSSSSRSS